MQSRVSLSCAFDRVYRVASDGLYASKGRLNDLTCSVGGKSSVSVRAAGRAVAVQPPTSSATAARRPIARDIVSLQCPCVAPRGGTDGVGPTPRMVQR